jgi:hypothetical protein
MRSKSSRSFIISESKEHLVPEISGTAFVEEGLCSTGGFNLLWALDSPLLAPTPGSDSQEFAIDHQL